MEQETTSEAPAFEPKPLGEILRDPAPVEQTERAGRPEPEAPQAAPVETGDKPAPAPVERPRDDAGRFAPKAQEQAAGPPPEPKQDAPQTVPIAAVLEERKKRQALEARLRELEARVSAPPAPQQPAQPDVPLSDLMFQDPDRFIQAVRAPIEEQLVQTRIAMSEQVARREPDYAEAEDALARYVQANPQVAAHVRDTLRSHPAPAMWALEQGRQLLAQQKWGQVIQQYGSPEAFIAAQRAAAAPPHVAPSPAPAAPPASLASVRSAGPRTAPTWIGPTPLSNILGTRR